MIEQTADGAFQGLIRACLAGPEVKTRNSLCRRALCQRFRFARMPLVGVRKTAWRNSLREWEWFMSGSNRLDDLDERVRHWWRPWARPSDGTVPFNYSVQFRSAAGRESNVFGVDQIDSLIDGVRNHPFGRRHVVTTWNAADMLNPACPITNCHNTVTQLFVDPDGALNMRTYQRSVDVVCGLPHNWLQQWAFLVWLASRTGLRAGWLDWEGGDCHVYEAHRELAERLLELTPRPQPELVYAPTAPEFLAADFGLGGTYSPLNTEPAVMVV